ncbi:MAG: ATP-binding protein [Candidatus Paceibacterota bacterium]|jgi:signal transduction histidine kinase/HAMP domain-containing protein
MRLSLVKKLVIFIELIVIITILLGGVITYLTLQDALQTQINGQLQSIAVLKENTINTYLKEASSEVEYTITDEYRREQFISFIEGREKENKDVLLKIISDIASEKSTIFELSLFDTQGEIILSTNKEEEGKIKSSELFFSRAKEKIVIQDYYYDLSSGKPAMLIAAPIKNKEGILLGILAGKINVDEISALMVERSGLGNTGETFLVNSFNMAVTSLLKEPGAVFRRTIYLPQVNNCLRGNSSFGKNIDYHGDDVIGYWHWVPQLKSCLVTKIDSVEVLAPVWEATKFFLELLALLGLFMGMIGYMGGRSVIRPLLNLRTKAQKIENGDFNVGEEKERNTHDEISDVSLAFNGMALRLRTTYENLEQKIWEVKEERARLLSSINSLSFGFIIADMNHRVVVKNKAMIRFLGIDDKSELSVQEISKTLGEHENIQVQIDSCIKSNMVCEINEINFGKKIFRGIVAPITVADVSEKNIGYVFLLEDITEQKVLERGKDEFFSIASHELRTPLTAIRGNISLLQKFYADRIENKEVNAMIADIGISSERLIRIVNDFLDMSRLEQKKIEFKKEKIDVSQVIDELVGELKNLAIEKNLELRFDRPQVPLPLVLADKERMKQILMNLVGNAIHYTPKGSIIITASIKDSLLKIAVKDTGLGISPQNQSLLFRKFQQAGHDSLARDISQSTGLGLYISRLIVNMMGGSIELEESTVGGGSTFSFTLPVLKD